MQLPVPGGFTPRKKDYTMMNMQGGKHVESGSGYLASVKGSSQFRGSEK